METSIELDGVTFLYVLVFSLLGTTGALIGAGVILRFPMLRARFRTPLLSYAVGTLLGATYLGLLPHSIEEISAQRALPTTLIGILGFFFLEKMLRLPHIHGHSAGHSLQDSEHLESRPAATLILIGDAIHNLVDGILIATTFMVSVPLGIGTAFAVIAHEIPQELGDFVILLEGGLNPRRAYLLNFLASLTTVVGAMLTLSLQQEIRSWIPYILAISAASFTYISMVDLAPLLHHHVGLRAGFRQALGLLTGIGTIALIHRLSGE